MMESIIDRRRRLLGPHVTTFYKTPLHLERGDGVWLWDKAGRKYLDCYNNVPHVGHCHPRVVEAIARQAATLNTHTRYLHDGVLDYLDRLTGKFTGDLSAAVMVCSGSEANDVALRMAQAMTGKTGLIGTDNTYHGNTSAVSQLNASKTPVGGYASHVRQVPAPDNLHPIGGDRTRQNKAFLTGIETAIADLNAAGHGISALILCPFFANEGMPTVEKGFLNSAVAAVRRAGGLIIADEVQPGFGRLGSHWWGHQRLGITPDIVTLGKPMANGHPVAAVVTGHIVLKTFQEAFKYFNTFGGNPVSAAAAMATLQVIEDENLVQNAQRTGDYALRRFAELANKHTVIGDVRGAGLFLGLELVLDADNTPASTYCGEIVEAMRERGVLLHATGKNNNTLKIRPPCVFGTPHVDLLVETLDDALSTLPVTR